LNSKNKQRIAGKSMSGQVYDILLARILRLELKPREHLSEAQFAKELGVSRTPVRESFLKLASLGFLEIVPQRGTFVVPLRIKAYRKAQFMREAFELALVREAVALKDNGDLCRALEKQMKLQEVYSDIGDEDAFFMSDEAFHEAIAVHCGQADLWPEVMRVKLHMDRFRYINMSQIETRRVVLEQHHAIAGAICARNEQAAIKAMATHLRRANRLIELGMVDHPDYFEPDE